ncbi:ReoY family proteolytic degradation factor [Lentibacillus saliphilus]|uniref:ReoY family proteolytic degradation factor n=1 Tax=Lentibacillus saliphilus TaxID=2737028 RepID=UPI001C30CBE3
MQTPISTHDKQSFIKWFLNHYQLKKRESVWILNYLSKHHNVLSNVHFVRNIKFCPRGIIMTSQCSQEVPFRFYKKQIVTTNAEKSFHDIRLNQEEPLYIQLNFNNSHQSTYYAAVLEENPFIPDAHFITKKDEVNARQLLDYTLYQYKKKKIQTEIDKALENRNEACFMKLAKQLKHLEDRYGNQPDSF